MKKLSVVLGLVAAVMFLIGSGEFLCAEQAKNPVEGQNWTSPSTGMEFVWIEALEMWVGKYEATNEEYRMKEPAHDSGDYKGHTLNKKRQPVVKISFLNAKEYAEWMTERDRGVLPSGYRYRLPSRNEWMTFVRCGDDRKYPWGNNWPPVSGKAGNYSDETAGKKLGETDIIQGYDDGHAVTGPVDELWINRWGLAGVGGNAWEACASDSTGESFGAWKGAAWTGSFPTGLRCSRKLTRREGDPYGSRGFRLVLSR